MKKPELCELTLREKIGQLVHVRPHHIYVNPETKRAQTKENVKKIIDKEQYGSLWVEDSYGYAEYTALGAEIERRKSGISEYDGSGKARYVRRFIQHS